MRNRFILLKITLSILAILVGIASLLYSHSVQTRMIYLLKLSDDARMRAEESSRLAKDPDLYKKVTDELSRLETDMLELMERVKP